jgi:hypothetical protein
MGLIIEKGTPKGYPKLTVERIPYDVDEFDEVSVVSGKRTPVGGGQQVPRVPMGPKQFSSLFSLPETR